MKKWIIAIIVAIVMILGYILFFWNNPSADYLDYDESLYSNEAILKEYDVFENEYIKFLYPKDWEIVKENSPNTLIYSQGKEDYGYINVQKVMTKVDYFKYFNFSDKLIERLADKANVLPTGKSSKIIKQKVNGDKCIIIDTLIGSEVEKDIRAITFDVEHDEAYIYFAVCAYDDNYASQKVILDSIVIK